MYGMNNIKLKKKSSHDLRFHKHFPVLHTFVLGINGKHFSAAASAVTNALCIFCPTVFSKLKCIYSDFLSVKCTFDHLY
jgi:hypothetical protein